MGFDNIPNIVSVFDRTLADVNFAFANQHLPNNKGALYYSDLNRIEGNVQTIVGMLNTIGYNLTLVIKTDWSDQDVVTLDEMNRVRSNVIAVVSKYADFSICKPVIKTSGLDYIQVNIMEKNLQLLFDNIKNYGKQNLYVGTIYGGEIQL